MAIISSTLKKVSDMDQKDYNNQLSIVPINLYIKQLEQMAGKHEWDGEYQMCDVYLSELQHVREYQLQTGSLYYPLF